RYDDILIHGLPDWRQPFYYRRVRKMSNGELGFLLFLILTVGHYAVLWSIYLEKQLDEMLTSSRAAEEPRSTGPERCSPRAHAAFPPRVLDRPRWRDLLPLKLSVWVYSVRNLPQTVQGVKQCYEDYQQMKQQQKEAEA
uniref:Uncharacterized protein n=1 Tax=Tetraodon nigroviridis TaxID=99883 RepID=H3DQG7_TETNG